jgi:DNA-binding NtrC family response regulator
VLELCGSDNRASRGRRRGSKRRSVTSLENPRLGSSLDERDGLEAKGKIEPRILIIDPEKDRSERLGRDLIGLGYRTFIAADSEQTREFLCAEQPDALFCDVLALTGSPIFALLREFATRSPIVVVTEAETLLVAADFLRHGASFYVLRPLTLKDLKSAVEQALDQRLSATPVRAHLQCPAADQMVVGVSPVIRQLLELTERVAMSDANVVIYGESGTGKELFAKVIHSFSRRYRGVFAPVDCASLPENLVEAELFGYEKGAFTGAIQAKPGLMEVAQGGTLFFDEIAELPLAVQPKLLRAVQERRHRRLGGTKIIDFDVRVVCATNRNLADLVAQGRFRQDLFYRLNVVPLHLPPLRMRGDDVVILANHFLRQSGRNNSSSPIYFADDVITLFRNLPWPGNVRQLQNVVEYCCAVAQGEVITVHDLPDELQIFDLATTGAPTVSATLTFRAAKANFEVTYVKRLLKQHDYNVSQAARAAAVDRKTLYALLQKHGITCH